MKRVLNGVFLTLLSLSAVVFLIQAFVWGLRESYVFALPLFRDVEEIPFADFWHTNHIAHENSPYYGDLSSYPPLVHLIALLFVPFADYSKGYESVYLEPGAQLSLFLFYLVFALLFAVLLFVILAKKRVPLLMQVVFVLTSFFTVGMIYEYERGNYILFALLPALFFFGFYDDRNPALRECAYLALGVSAGIKLYPALFALVLLKERRWIPFLRCAAYSLLFLFVPFLFLDRGFANISQFLRWLASFANEPPDVGYNLSAANLAGICAALLHGVPLSELNSLDFALWNYVALALCLLGGLFSKRTYQVMLAAALGMIFFPNPSYTYSEVFLVLPMLAYLTEREKDGWDIPYLGLLVLAVLPIYMGTVDADASVHVNQLLSSAALAAMALLLAIEAIVRHIPSRKKTPLVEPIPV